MEVESDIKRSLRVHPYGSREYQRQNHPGGLAAEWRASRRRRSTRNGWESDGVAAIHENAFREALRANKHLRCGGNVWDGLNGARWIAIETWMLR